MDNKKGNQKDNLMKKYKETGDNQFRIEAESIERNREANENIRIIIRFLLISTIYF